MENTQTILVVEIVEDDISLKKALAEKLAHEGFSVLQAKNGKDGLDLALAHHPDLILLDLKMPVMDGMEMLGLLRNDPWGKNARVIILTNLDKSTNVAEAMNKNTFDFFVKSDIRLEEVVEKIKEKIQEPIIQS